MRFVAHFALPVGFRHGGGPTRSAIKRHQPVAKTLSLAMRLTAFLLLAGCLQVSARGYSQISLHLKDVPLGTVLEDLRHQATQAIVYTDQMLVTAHRVTIDISDVSLEQALDDVLRDQPLTWSVTEGAIVLKPKGMAAPVVSPVPADIDLHGRVTDSSGIPLVGASVTVKGMRWGTVTDAKGQFELKNVPPGAILQISYLGYEGKEVPVTVGSLMAIHMAPATNKLDEAQVIAYGTTTRRLNTGDVGTVKAEDIEKQPVSNPLAAMEGRVPGMFITQSTGAPGGNFSVQIRGKNSIVNGNDPLYVIDGVPYSSQLLTNENLIGNSGSPLNFINPADIESIDVLKDADATAIYGSRGANGVVLITTKKGKAGKSQVNVSAYGGIGEIGHYMGLLSTPQYLQMRREAFKNDNVTPTVTNAPDLLFWDTTRYTNWQKMLIGGTAHYADAQASVSGGNTLTQYTFGGGYHRETTVFPGDFGDQKGSVHFSITHVSPSQKFKATLSGNYLMDNENLPQSDLTGQIRTLPPDAPPVHNADGTLNWAENASGTPTWTNTNPFAILLPVYQARTNNLVGNSVLSYQLLRGLELKASLGYTNMQVNEITDQPIASLSPTSALKTGSSFFTSNNIRSWIIEPHISYQRLLGPGKLEALVGTTFQQSTSEGQILDATGYTSDALLKNIQGASSITVTSATDIQYKYNALFGRLNYNWNDKYLIDLTARRDGSSRFGPDRQFHNFGAAGAAWIFSKEDFIRDHWSFLSFGKLRVSYGTTGNDQVGDYRFLDLYSTNQYPYQGIQSIYPANLYNPDLAWEENKKLEGGMELGFLQDRLQLTGSYFRNRSSNELVSYPLPGVTGFTSIAANLPAVVQNAGWEFLLNTVNIRSKNFSWSSSLNLTIYRNKLVAFPGLATSSYSTRYLIGQPLSITKAYHFIGVNDTTGVYEFATSKGTPTYTPAIADQTVVINTDPRFYGGFQNSFLYKGFQLDIFFQFVKQRGINYLYSYTAYTPGYQEFNQPAAVMGSRWQAPGDNASFQKFTQATGSAYNAYYNYIKQSDKGYSDASYIRLKNVALSYQLPAAWRQRVHLQSASIFLQGQNLLTFTHHYAGFDPETQSVTGLPVLRVVTGGVRLSL